MPKETEYKVIARQLRAEVVDGVYDADGSPPGNAAIASRFDVNLKTAGRAIQQLIAEGLLVARPGLRPLIVPQEHRATNWQMAGRYAKARAAQQLVFASDLSGEMRKETVGREWVDADIQIAKLLGVKPGDSVFHRSSRTYVNDKCSENTSMFFPAGIVEQAPGLENDDSIKVVGLIESAGHVVARTSNEIRARLANGQELELFGLAVNAVVIEQSHGTYSSDDVALEAVVNVRPAEDNRITFDTYEGPDIDGEQS